MTLSNLSTYVLMFTTNLYASQYKVCMISAKCETFKLMLYNISLQKS